MIKVDTQIIHKDHGKRALEVALKRLMGSHSKVGFLRGGARDPKNNFPIAQQAAVHEYGSPSQGIPARPFMQQTWDRNLAELRRIQDGLLSRLYKGTTTPEQMVKQVGIWYKGRVQATITTGDFRPLKPATIARKKSSKPLIDTGLMRASVNHEEYIP